MLVDIAADGEWVGTRPKGVESFSADVIASGEIRLRWTYRTAYGGTGPTDFGIYYSTTGPDITLGTGLIFLGLVFDGMDGAAARRFGTKHDFGRHLDSISDSITFCLAPSVLVAAVFYVPLDGKFVFSVQALTMPANILVFIAVFCIIIFGFKRLINFTLSGYKLEEFFGLATPERGEEEQYASRLEEIAGDLPTVFFVKNSSLFVGGLLAPGEEDA